MLRLKTEKFLSKLYKKERKRCYENLDMKNVTDNTKCWKTVIPFFLDKLIGYKNFFKKTMTKSFLEDYKAAE